MSNTEISDEIVEDQESIAQETDANGLPDSTVDAIASVVVIACLVAIAATYISGGLA